MKIYLIKPRFPVTYWGFEYSNDLSGVTYTSPPLSLATIAALTPADIEVEICDENIEEIDFDKECDLVGLTAYLMQGPRAFRIAEEFRKRGKLVALGGPITGLNLEDCRGKADVLFVGEAEYTWPKFLDDLRRGSYQPEYLQTKKIDMCDSPIPRMDLLKLEKYVHAAIQTTRGCPFGCEFCDIVVLFGRKVRSKRVEQVIAELQEAVKQPIGSIFFTDDNFIGNKRYAKELLQAIIEFNKSTKIPLSYMTQVSINLARDDELLDLLNKANVTNVFIGIETPRKSSLQEVNKGQNVRTNLLEDVKKIQSYNISVSAGMIVGFDHDDERIFQEQLDFIMEANIPWAMTGILQAVPETPLYKRLEHEQRLDLTSEYFEVDNTALDVNIVPKNMSKERLIQGYTWLVRQLYTPENYAKRVIGSILNYSQRAGKNFSRPTRWQINVVLRALKYYLLTLDRKRRHFFWEIVSATLRHKPSAIVDAMTYVVSFKHLHTYVYNYLETVLKQKAVSDASTLPMPAAESKRSLENTYGELRKHTSAISAQAALAYEELREQLALFAKHAAEEYEELKKQATHSYEGLKIRAAATNEKAAEAGEELRKYAEALNNQALARYEELYQQAVEARAQATLAYEELGKQAHDVGSQASQRYEELRVLASEKSEQARLAYEDLRNLLRLLSKHIVTVYAELGEQAAGIRSQAANLSKPVAALYGELEEEAGALSSKARLFLDELEQKMADFSLPQTIREG